MGYELYLDGSSSPFASSRALTATVGVPSGNHTVTVAAYDASGNVSLPSGSTALTMPPYGNGVGLIKVYNNFAAFINDYLAGKLTVGSYAVLGNRMVLFYYDGAMLRANDGRQAVRAVGGNASLPDQFYAGAHSTLSYSTHVAQGNILALGVSVANFLFNESWGTSVTNPTNPTAPFAGSNTITGPITVEQAVEYPIGVVTRQRLTFNGGASQAAIAAGTRVDSDLTPLTTMIPSGSKFRIWHLRVTNGIDSVAVDRNCYFSDTGENLVYQNTTPGNFGATNVVTGTLAAATATGSYYGNQGVRPACIFGITDAPMPAVAAIGDSRVYGTYEEPDQSRFLGSIERMIGSILTTQRFGRGGETGANFVSATGSLRRAIINKYFTHAVCDYGVNDVYGGGIVTTVAMAAMLNNIAQSIPNVQMYACTIRPVTSSSDGWITASGQQLGLASESGGGYTAAQCNSARIAFNWMLRTAGAGKGAISASVPGGLAGVYDYFDLANDVECNGAGVLTQDGGLWNPITATLLTCVCVSNTVTLSTAATIDLTGALVVSSPGSTGNGARFLSQSTTNPLVWYIDGAFAVFSWASGTVVINNSTQDGLHELPGSNRLHNPAGGAKFPLYAFT